MRNGNAAAGHKQVFDVAGVETAIGNRVAETPVDSLVVFCNRDKWIVGKFFSVLLFGIVQID